MNRRATDVMASAPRTAYDARLSGVRGTCLFHVGDVADWRLRIDNGHVALFDGSGVADLALSLDEPTFVDLIEGRQNFVTGLLQGKIRAEGDLALALKFHGILLPRAAQ